MHRRTRSRSSQATFRRLAASDAMAESAGCDRYRPETHRPPAPPEPGIGIGRRPCAGGRSRSGETPALAQPYPGPSRRSSRAARRALAWNPHLVSPHVDDDPSPPVARGPHSRPRADPARAALHGAAGARRPDAAAGDAGRVRPPHAAVLDRDVGLHRPGLRPRHPRRGSPSIPQLHRCSPGRQAPSRQRSPRRRERSHEDPAVHDAARLNRRGAPVRARIAPTLPQVWWRVVCLMGWNDLQVIGRLFRTTVVRCESTRVTRNDEGHGIAPRPSFVTGPSAPSTRAARRRRSAGNLTSRGRP
jgi:hypothetical protein